MKLFRPALTVLACALALSACGDSEKSPAASEGLALSDAKTVVVDYLGKGFVGDAAACEHETEKFTADQNETNGVEECAERIEAIKMLLTDGEPLIDVKALDVEVAADGKAAVVEVADEEEGFSGAFRLVAVDGVWMIDEEVAAEGSLDGEASEDGRRSVSEDEAKALASAFCEVAVGTSRSDVEAILGAPSAEGVDDDGQAEIDWFINEDSYTVWFEDDAVASYSSSTPREDEACEA